MTFIYFLLIVIVCIALSEGVIWVLKRQMVKVNKTKGEVTVGVFTETLTKKEMDWFMLYTNLNQSPQEIMDHLMEIVRCR
jgi:hypothetical protein